MVAINPAAVGPVVAAQEVRRGIDPRHGNALTPVAAKAPPAAATITGFGGGGEEQTGGDGHHTDGGSKNGLDGFEHGRRRVVRGEPLRCTHHLRIGWATR